ncbi:MAG: DUF1676 domain-containing protein [Candidatus Obscuribacterales bacterium]|jgi:hypothetical protein|nr:DUF1676 domain-containing protein [Candidatus Obscuribacterales bacterium]
MHTVMTNNPFAPLIMAFVFARAALGAVFLVVIALLAAGLVAILCGVEALLVAKIVLSAIMITFGLLACGITLIARSWQVALAEMETKIDEARDVVVLQATITRAQLAALKDRFSRRANPAEIVDVTVFLQHIGPVINLIVSRNPNVVSWGLTLFKLGRSVYSYFSKKGR